MGKFEEETIIEKEEREAEELKKAKKKKKNAEESEGQAKPLKTRKKKREKTVKIYAVVNYDTDFKEWLSAYVESDPKARQMRPLTFCASSEQAEEYCEQYFFMYNYRHFKLWCDCHEGEEVGAADSWFTYVEKVLMGTDDPDRQYLKICSFDFPLSEVASLLRLTLNSLPVGLDTEDPEIIPEIMVESISEGVPLPDNYLQILNGMKEYYQDYENRNNKNENDYLVSKVIEGSLSLYMKKMEELEDDSDEKCVS